MKTETQAAGQVRSAQEFCRVLLRRGDLASKLAPPRDASGRLLPVACGDDAPGALLAPGEPAREEPLRPGKQRGERLPPLHALKEPAARIECLRRFAHHELQAIELFAWAVLRFSDLPTALRRGFLLVLEEEQEHLRLYLERLSAHGAELASGPLSGYLLQHKKSIEAAKDPGLAFLCALGLTFEQANLDFASLYADAFAAAGDAATAAVLRQVHDDEIRHVRLAVRWLRRLKQPGETDLQAYLRAVPFPLSAARAKGRRYDAAARRQAGLDDDFIAYVAAAEPYRKPESGPAESAAEKDPHKLWLLPNLGAEEGQPVPASARGFLRGLYGAWAVLFDGLGGGADGLPWLLPPGDGAAAQAFRAALRELAGDAAFEKDATLPGLAGLCRPGGLVGWLGVPSAAETARAQLRPLLGPPPELVLRLNDKAWAQKACEALALQPACLRGLVAVFSAEECEDAALAAARLRSLVAAWPAFTGGRFVVKPRLGTSGRGRYFGKLEPGADSGAPLIPEAAFSALARRGGCVLEPWLDRILDLSTQLCVEDGGRGVRILGTTRQIVTQSGQILGNRGVVGEDGALRAGVDPAVEAAMRSAAEALGQAAAAQGFYGIAGVDAFLFRGPDGEPVLRPVVELNARFTTGTVTLGLVRRVLAAASPGPRAFALLLKAPDKAALEKAVAAGCRCLCPLARGPALVLADHEAALAPLLSA
jgi:uncharacterized ferritin-like protein (DUF455 family)